MNQDELINSLKVQAERDFEIACSNYDNKYYHFALFLGHLVLEKLLKAKFIQVNNDIYPPIHDLVLLAKKANLNLDNTQITELREISTFNIAGRYDDYKFTFYKKSKDINYSNNWFNKIKEYRLWLILLL